jgi:hypothetical protein
VWNEPLPAGAPLDPQSGWYVADLLNQVEANTAWINTYNFSTPVYTVPADEPTATVTLDNAAWNTGTALAQSWQGVPIPAGAQPAQGSDESMVVYQPSTNHMWEFWKMSLQADGWHAQWGGTIADVSTNPGYYTNYPQWGATATSLPLLGGLIRPSELASGQIDHALAIAVPQARASYFTWPAERTDGTTNSPTAIPEGQRFRLDPSLNLATIPMAPIVRMIAVAAQKYGIIVRDQAGAVTFFAEDTNAEGLPDPYYGPGGYFENQSIGTLLGSFPWSHLEALKDNLQAGASQ